MSVQETNGYLDVENATLRSSKIEVTSNLAIGNTNPQHAFSVGSNLYVSGDSPDVLTVDGNVVCEGVKVGLIEIIPSYDLEAVANVGNSTSNTIQFTNTDTSLVTSGRMNIGGDIIPDTDGVYDIGSPDFKIREVFTSDNSLWIGDQTKIAFENGKMRFKRRKLDKVPKVVRELVIGNVADITDEAGVESAAVAYAQEQFPDAGVTVLADLKLQHWKAYTKSIDETKEISDIFADNDEDYEAQSAAEAWIEIQNNIYSTSNVTIGAPTDPRATLDVVGDAKISSNLEVGTANLFVDTVSGNVGIGTTDTDHTLTVKGNFNIKNTMTTKLIENEPLWAARIGGTGQDLGNGIAVDSGGNVYVTGRHNSGSLSLYSENESTGTTETLGRVGNDDTFIAKYSTDGNILWAARIGGTGIDFGNGIAVDSDGNVYVTGYYYAGSLTLYDKEGVSRKSLSNSGNYDVFIAKYSTDGNVLWGARATATDRDEGHGIAVDSDGNVYVTGRYSSSPLTLYSQDESTGITESLATSGNYDAFIAKYSTAGNVLWAARISGTNNTVQGFGIAVDSGGNVYVTGYSYNVGITLYNADESTSTGIELTNDGSGDVFIAKYSTGGTAQWAAKISESGYERGSGIAVDSDGNVYVTGFYSSSTLYLYNKDGVTTETLNNSNSGNYDVFIAKYSTAGNVLWAARIGGSARDEGHGIAVDSGGNVYVTGSYLSSPLTLYSQDESSTTKTLTVNGNDDVFIAKYSTAGNVLWAARISGGSVEQGTGIAVDSGGNFYVTGRYTSSTITLYNEDESSSIELTNGGYNDIFIAKYGSGGRVGIGVENPSSAIDVAGQVKANGTILTFTGQHICTPEGPMDQGLIVSANKNMYTTLNGPLLIGSRAIQSSESLPVVCLSSIENDPSVFGVVDHLENGGTQRLQERGGMITKSTKIIGDDRVIVNSSGEGAMWVVNTNGSLLSGDYITTSSISGYGHKQDDDILHSYTVAKITMDCDFNPEDLPIQVITKDENGNNVLDNYGRLQWEDTDRVEKAYQVRYLTSEGEVTDEANAVWTAAYVGCTYHCG
jgi:Tfp pilus assembly protein PilZ